VYIGIAQAASAYAVQFASEYSPNTLPGPIKDVPEVQRKVGEIELEIFKAREVLFSVARKWVLNPNNRLHMNHELAAVKHIATNSANRVVDLAMRVVGARSLSEKSPLQRYFRDVRAGLHNPPFICLENADSLLKTKGTGNQLAKTHDRFNSCVFWHFKLITLE
jgi:alkylation response protein AidB-like acyl-CoA dehydrogenase